MDSFCKGKFVLQALDTNLFLQKLSMIVLYITTFVLTDFPAFVCPILHNPLINLP